jgi:hypothetical protein
VPLFVCERVGPLLRSRCTGLRSHAPSIRGPVWRSGLQPTGVATDKSDEQPGAQYDPRVLTGLSMWQIATQFEEPSSWVAKLIGGSAHVLIKAIDHARSTPPRIAGPDLLAYCCSG